MSGHAREALFLVGVGGMGMAPLAVYLAQQGYEVYGYDDAINQEVKPFLDASGVVLLEDPSLPKNIDRVIISSAIKPSHPCYSSAQEQGIPVVYRGEYLSRLSSDKKLIAIIGSHGKTTTAALLVFALQSIGFSFDYILGGLYRGGSIAPARGASCEWLVAEVDESDGFIETFSPEITIALNFDWDHVARYPSESDLENAFGAVLRNTKTSILYWEEDEKLRLLVKSASCEKKAFACDGGYQATIEDAGFFSQRLVLGGEFPSRDLLLPTGGAYNARNAIAALAAINELGESIDNVSMAGYPGVYRRQDLLFQCKRFSIIADYAHHPTEIEALLTSLRTNFSEHKITVIFQPHRYTRTQHLSLAFASSLKAADKVHLMPVYAASEEVLMSGMSTAILNACSGDESRVVLWPEGGLGALEEEIVSQSIDAVEPQVFAFVGAGDIDRFAATCSRSVQAHLLSAGLSSSTLFLCDESLAKKTTLRVGGLAKYYAEPASVEDLTSLLSHVDELSIPVFMLGRGSNVIISDEGFPGLVLRLNHPNWRFIEYLGDGRFRVGAGARLKELCGRACKEGYSGLEFLEGIPGSLGGALRMNAGAMGGWMFDIVESVEWIAPNGELRQDSKESFHVEYRACKELLDGFAISAIVRAPQQEAQGAVAERMQVFAVSRKASQPRESSAGCMFKNPPNGFAGQLIDELGLKGLSCGDAAISRVHGNFIINRGNATCLDVLKLVRRVHEVIRKERGIALEPEVLLLGKNWKDVLYG